ncbi:MAG: cell wall-binding repeat-containing protein [Desulfosporosinus sp.]|nr:cell wall-binding repeat-containing protein [Desulfosporosinus sp.]
MEKAKKTLASLAIAGMVLTSVPFNTYADTGVTTARLCGTDRVGTAVAIADAGWTTAGTAILAPADDADLVDALLAAPLAGKTDPILLTDNNTLTPATQAELLKLDVKNVFVVGSISQTVIDQLNAIGGVTATILNGSDSISIATKISAKLINPAGSFVVGYGALADALSIASYAAANNYSILVANPDGTLPASEIAYKGATTYIIGGPTLVADIPGTTRLFGTDRFATNLTVLKALTYKYDNVYVANGTDTHLVDSIVALSLAAESCAPIVLCDTNGSTAASDIHAKLAANAVVTALGGVAVVPDSIRTEVVTGVANCETTETATSVIMSDLTISGQKVGTGAKVTPAVGLVNSPITVSSNISGAATADGSVTYLVSFSDNITAQDSNEVILEATALSSPVIIGNDTFTASYTVPVDASGNVEAFFTANAISRSLFNVVIKTPFSNNGPPVLSSEGSIEWGAPGSLVLSPVYAASDPDCLNFSTPDAPTRGWVPVSATILPADGSSTELSGQPIKFRMTVPSPLAASSNVNAFFTDDNGTPVVMSAPAGGSGSGIISSLTYVANTDDNGQALAYINSNLSPDQSGTTDLEAIMAVSIQAQLVNQTQPIFTSDSIDASYFQWKHQVSIGPSRFANKSKRSI